MYPFQSFQCSSDWGDRDVIVWAAATTFGLSAVIWASCQFDFPCVPVDVGVVLHEPGVSQDNCLMANTRDIEFVPALVTLVLDNEIDCFGDLPDLIWRSVCIIQPNRVRELIGPKLMSLDNSWSINSPIAPQSISAFIASGRLLSTIWTWIGM